MFINEKIKTLPEKVQDILFSDAVFDLLDSTYYSLNITHEEYEILRDIITGVCVKEISVDKFYDLLKEKLKRPEKELKELAFTVCANIFEQIKDHLDYNVEEYIKKIGLDVEKFKKQSEFFSEVLKYEIELFPDEPKEEPEEVFNEKTEEQVRKIVEEHFEKALTVEDYDKERTDLKQVFRLYISTLLFSKDEDYKQIINHRLLDTLINSDITFLNDLISAVRENDYVLTKDKILVDSEMKLPTVENWLKDIVHTVGTAKFSQLQKAQYLGASANVAKLSPEEKERVATVMEFYRMLVNFPDSVSKLPPEQWYIIPIKTSEIQLSKQTPEKNISATVETQNLASPQGKPKPTPPPEKNKPEPKPFPENPVPPPKPKTPPKKKSLMISKSNLPKKIDTEKKEVMPADDVRTRRGAFPQGKSESTLSPQPKPEPAPTPAMSDQEKIRAKYIGDAEENQNIKWAMEKISNVGGNDSKLLVNMLHKAITPKKNILIDKPSVVAILRVLAMNKELDAVLEDKRFADIIKNESSKIKDKKDPDKLNILLKYIFENLLKLKTDEAARQALHIANISKKSGNEKYSSLAWFNMDKGEFEFS